MVRLYPNLTILYHTPNHIGTRSVKHVENIYSSSFLSSITLEVELGYGLWLVSPDHPFICKSLVFGGVEILSGPY